MPHVAVDGFEEQALTVLINLVYKRSEIDDLTSVRTAKSVLRDEVCSAQLNQDTFLKELCSYSTGDRSPLAV